MWAGTRFFCWIFRGRNDGRRAVEDLRSQKDGWPGPGRMLLPGLWDMHAHLFPQNSFLDIASCVPTARAFSQAIEVIESRGFAVKQAFAHHENEVAFLPQNLVSAFGNVNEFA